MRSSDGGWTLPSLGDMPDEPQWRVWSVGVARFRVIPSGGDPRWFNPNTATDPMSSMAGGRFHPFAAARGGRVPTLYAASTLKAAIAESLLHDLSLTPPEHPYSLSMTKVAQHQFAVLSPVTDLRLIDLSGLGADRVRVPNELISWCAREDYPFSRAAAQLLHTKYETAHGILWISRRYPPAECTVIFGDRIPMQENALLVEAPSRRDLHEPGTEGYSDLEAVIREAGIVPTP